MEQVQKEYWEVGIWEVIVQLFKWRSWGIYK